MNGEAVPQDDAIDPVYLESLLAPLAELLRRPGVTDLYVNRPGEAWVEMRAGRIERHVLPGLSESALIRLARQIAAHASQGISRASPILSAALPDGTRVQAIAPPATRGGMAFAFRKHLPRLLSLAEHREAGLFDEVRDSGAERRAVDAQLDALLAARNFDALLALAVRARRNILVSGGTSSGKTTLLASLIAEIPPEERLILIEDAPELVVRHPNHVGLLATRSGLGEAEVSADDLLSATLRMRPDRILLGELRGPEAFAFLRAVNSGHPGSMTTIHADDPQGAIDQLVLLALQAGTALTRADIRHYVAQTIDVFVQMRRAAGRRYVSEIVLRR